MAAGSTERDEPHDARCRHCGLFYSAAGITPHEDNCEWCEFDGYHPRAVVEDESEVLADRFSKPPSEGEGARASEGPKPPSKQEGASAHEHTPPESSTTATPVRTDGGNPALDAPEPVPVTDGGETDDDAEVCPDCGSPDWFDADELAEATNAEGAAATMLAKFERVCVDCREAYNV